MVCLCYNSIIFIYKVSIIVPAFNAEKIIKRCLNKILHETKNIMSEIIVVDDCSTDNTLKIISKFKKIKIISYFNLFCAGWISMKKNTEN